MKFYAACPSNTLQQLQAKLADKVPMLKHLANQEAEFTAIAKLLGISFVWFRLEFRFTSAWDHGSASLTCHGSLLRQSAWNLELQPGHRPSPGGSRSMRCRPINASTLRDDTGPVRAYVCTKRRRTLTRSSAPVGHGLKRRAPGKTIFL